jgi:hypothetical protein
MSLFEPLHSEACQAIVGGSILTAKPSEAYPRLFEDPTNYGQSKKSYEGPSSPNNPSSWYGAGTSYGQFVKANN